MTVSPKVSVLIPVYNGELYLAECLDSILMQDFREVEILISDDDSTDHSRELIEKYAARDSRIRWWKNPRRTGLTANSNICLRAATGKYVKFVHQDDKLLSPLGLRKLAAALDEYPSAALAGSRQHITGKKSPMIVFPGKTGLYDGRQTIVASLERNANLVGQPCLTMLRRAFAHRGFDERFTGHMDFEMWCHLLEQGDFMYLDEPLATWRVHEKQQTAINQRTGVSNHEHLLFMETYSAKPWMQQSATDRLRFIQIYYLRKKYGHAADDLTRKMMADLPPYRYAWQLMKHKVSKPFRNLNRKLNQPKPV